MDQSQTKGILTKAKVLIFSGGAMLLVAVYALANARTASANTSDINNFTARYGFTSGTRIDPNSHCNVCHTSIPSLNAYGSAYRSNGRSGSGLAAIESADSDGDGFSNLTEINALTFPGDAADHPAPPTATRVPPTATQVPPTATPLPPTATQVPPTATQAPPTATRTPAATRYTFGYLPTPSDPYTGSYRRQHVRSPNSDRSRNSYGNPHDGTQNNPG